MLKKNNNKYIFYYYIIFKYFILFFSKEIIQNIIKNLYIFINYFFLIILEIYIG